MSVCELSEMQSQDEYLVSQQADQENPPPYGLSSQLSHIHSFFFISNSFISNSTRTENFLSNKHSNAGEYKQF